MVSDGPPDPAFPSNDAKGPTREQLEALRRGLAQCVRLETQLAAASRAPAFRRAGADALGVLAIVLAVISALVLINVAILLALVRALPGWAAALILATAWIMVAVLAAAIVARHGAPMAGLWRRGRPGSVDELRAERDRAWQTLQQDLERLAPALTECVIDAAAPIAVRVGSRMAADAAGEAVDEVEDVGRELIEESEEIVEELAEEAPGASIVATAWDLALRPGRTGARMVTTILKRPPPKS